MFDPFFALLFLAAIIVPVVAFLYWARPKRRSRGNAGCLVPLICAVAAIAGFLFYAGPDLFVTNDGIVQMYVIAPQRKAEGFTDDLAGMAKGAGMTAYVDHTPANGMPFHILEARGKWLRLWSQNIPLDPNLPMKDCGPQTAADPGQYSLMVFRILPFGTEHAAQSFSLELASKLRAAGYDVRSKPLLCSPWLKNRGAH